MHTAAYDWAQRHVPTISGLKVLELGSLWVNGGVRDLFRQPARYVGLDLQAGKNVDVVADAADWEPDDAYDAAISTELLEHTPRWREILATAWQALKPGGLLILTFAGPGRHAHGQHGAPTPADGEWYENVHPGDLAAELFVNCWRIVTIDVAGPDVRALAVKPEWIGEKK